MKINHVAVMVANLDDALNFWQQALGLSLAHTEHDTSEEVDIAHLRVGGGEIELIAPFTNTSGVARYLEKKGAGLHHLCLEVANLDATMQHITACGVELINDTPRTRADGIRYAFVHPRSTGGVLVELYELVKPGANSL